MTGNNAEFSNNVTVGFVQSYTWHVTIFYINKSKCIAMQQKIITKNADLDECTSFSITKISLKFVPLARARVAAACKWYKNNGIEEKKSKAITLFWKK